MVGACGGLFRVTNRCTTMNDWLEAEQRVERAQELTESQRWTEALGEMDAALAINPNNALWHAQRGCLLEELERRKDAVQAYEAALHLDPEDRDVRMALGHALARLGRFAKALSIFERLSSAYPDFEPSYCQRVACYAALGRHEQAEQVFYQAQELDDECPHCFFHMGESLAARGDVDRALYCWNRVLEIEPAYIGVHRRIAQVLRAQGKRSEARENYVRELRDDPGDVDLLFELGELAMESGEFGRAAAKFAQIIELEPEHVPSHFALAKIWLFHGEIEGSLKCFGTIVKLSGGSPELPDFHRRYGEALLAAKKYDDASEQLAMAVDSQPQERDVQMLYGTSLLARCQWRVAAKSFRQVLAIDNEHAQAHHSLGICLFQLDRFEPGLDHCLDAIRIQPDFSAAMYHAAVAQARLGRWSDAKAMLRRTLTLDADNEAAKSLAKRLWRCRLSYFVQGVLSRLRLR